MEAVDGRYFEVQDIRIEPGILNGREMSVVRGKVGSTWGTLVSAASLLLQEDLDVRSRKAAMIGNPGPELPHRDMVLDVSIDHIIEVLNRMVGKLPKYVQGRRYVLGPMWARLRDEPGYQLIMTDYGIYEVDLPIRPGPVEVARIMDRDFSDGIGK